MPRSAPSIHSSLTICFKPEFGLQAGLSIFLQGDLLLGVAGCGPAAASAPPPAPGLCATGRGDSQNAAAICWHRPPGGAGVMPAIASSLSIAALGVKKEWFRFSSGWSPHWESLRLNGKKAGGEAASWGYTADAALHEEKQLQLFPKNLWQRLLLHEPCSGASLTPPWANTPDFWSPELRLQAPEAFLENRHRGRLIYCGKEAFRAGRMPKMYAW